MVSLSIEMSRGRPGTILKRRLLKDRNVTRHQEDVQIRFTFLQIDDLQAHQLALGSSYDAEYRSNPDFDRYCQNELVVRVGYGHDILNKLRLLSGLRVFYIHKHKGSRGLNEAQQAGQTQKRAKKDQHHWVKAYVDNYKKLQVLLDATNASEEDKELRLKGLQQLNGEEDVALFNEWARKVREGDGEGTGAIPWIWTVAMLEDATGNGRRSTKDMLLEWESEGMSFL
jgi:hypothetical protein